MNLPTRLSAALSIPSCAPAPPAVSPVAAPARDASRAGGAALASAAAGGLLGLGCCGLLPWAVSAAALVAFAWQVQRSLAGATGRGSLLSLAAGMLAMQTAGGWWLVLGLDPRGPAWPWQALALALAMGVQATWFVAAWTVAHSAARRLPRGAAGAGAALAWGLAWGGGEALRELGPFGDGYTVLGTALLQAPGIAGWLPVAGVHGVSMLVALVAWLGARGVQAFIDTAPGARATPRRAAGGAAAAALALAAAGRLLATIDWTIPAGPPASVTVVQDASAKREPWSVAARDSAEDRLLAAVRATPGGGVVATPEGHFADPLPMRPEPFWQALRDEAHERGVHVLVGMPQRAWDDGRREVLNAIVQVAPDRFGLYAKERLVPGGESLPLAALLSTLYDHAFGGRSPTPRQGERAAPPALTHALFVAGVPVGASICHELSFTTTMARRARGSAWLFNAADDAWIPSPAYRGQMAVIARTRALELAKPLLRVSDGGASMLVDADGRVQEAAPAATVATLHWRVQPRRGATPYERHADALALAPVGVLAALLAAGLAGRLRRLFHSALVTP